MDIELKLYNYDTKQNETVGKTSTYVLSRSLSHEQMAHLLDDWINSGMKDYRDGVEVGKVEAHTHPTLQGSLIRFCVGVIAGICVGKEYTDGRNEVPVAFGKKLVEMIEKGEFKLGWMI